MMEKMINTMMKRYQIFAWMGFLIVIVAFLWPCSWGPRPNPPSSQPTK